MSQTENDRLVRLCVRAARVAFRNVAPARGIARDDVVRCLQEVWEEEGADLAPLATWSSDSPAASDADDDMRQIYRARRRLPPESHCAYCGAWVETAKAARDTKGEPCCNAECQDKSDTFIKKGGRQ